MAEGEQEEDEEEDEEEESNGMQAPEGALPTHHEDFGLGFGDSESEGSVASSGLEDWDMEGEESEEEQSKEDFLEVDEEVTEENAVKKTEAGEIPKTGGGPKQKAYHTSEEWVQLLSIEEEKKVVLCRVPAITGAGLGRHPAGGFWSCRYPECSIKSCSWGSLRTPLECLLKCLKHLIRQHMLAFPNDPELSAWKSQLQSLNELTG